MQTRRRGRTGHQSSLIILGTAAFGRSEQSEADAAIDLALAHGVNHIDVAPTYGDAELRVAPWMPRIRKQVFLGSKTTKRTRQEAWDEMQRTLQRLQVQNVDLYQFHEVTTFADLEAIFAPGGALEAFVEAKKQGLTTHLGITGHGLDAPRIQLEALKRFDLDTVMFPLNFVLWANPQYRSDVQALLAAARERDLGVQCIKSICKAPWGDRERRYRPWYEPFDDLVMIKNSIRFALSQPVTGLPAASDTRLWPAIFDAADRFVPMTKEEQAALLATAGSYTPLWSPAPTAPAM
jgi:aryl-alcohol dehydrogenase-like predicted oxidoreductase